MHMGIYVLGGFNNKTPIAIATIFILSCIVYSLFVYAPIRQSSQNFVQRRSEDSLKVFATFSIVKGVIEAAKAIPKINILAKRIEPVEQIVDMLWYFSLLSYIFNQILDFYISTGSIFTLSIFAIIIYQLFKIVYLWRNWQIMAGILDTPIFRLVYRGALLFALILPLYIFISMNTYQWFDQEFVEPEYKAIVLMFSEVEAVEKSIDSKEKLRQTQLKKLELDIQDQKSKLAEMTSQMDTLQTKIQPLRAERWFFQRWFSFGESKEEQKLASEYDLVAERAEKLQQSIESAEKNLQRYRARAGGDYGIEQKIT